MIFRRFCLSLSLWRMCFGGIPRIRSEFTLHSESVAIEIEGNWDRNKAGGNTAKQGRGPLHAHILEHLAREQRETCSNKRPTEGVCSNGRCGTLTVLEEHEC